VRHGHTRDERGVTLILFALFLVALLVFAALVMDSGLVFNQRRQNQSAVDAASLAAMKELLDNPTNPNRYVMAVDRAIEVSYRNITGNSGPPDAAWTNRWLTCQDATPYPVQPPNPKLNSTDPCISFDNGDAAVRVRLPDISVGTTFGRVVGVDTYDTNAEAEAEVTYDVPYAIFATANAPPCNTSIEAVHIAGNRAVITGSVHSNSDISLDPATTVSGPVTYVSPPPGTGSTQPDPFALTVQYPHYAPGGWKANLALSGGEYRSTTGDINNQWLVDNIGYDPGSGNFDLDPTTSTLENNVLVHAHGHIDINGPLVGSITFVSRDGTIRFDGGPYDVQPWSGDPHRVLALSTAMPNCNESDTSRRNSIQIGNVDNSFFDGIVYATAGELDFQQGGQKTFNSVFVANSIDIDINNELVSINSTGFSAAPPELRLRK
jgi:hypothetical protein